MNRILVLSSLLFLFLVFSPLTRQTHAFMSLGSGDMSLLGGDLTDPEDDLDFSEPPPPNATEDQLKPKNADWVKMTFGPASPPDAAPHQTNPYSSWVGCPAAAIFYNTPEGKKWYISYKDGGRGGPTRDFPYFCAVELAQPVVLTHFTICNSPDMPERDPRSWAIQGSNTGKKDDWKDIFVCDYEKGDTSPFKKYPRNETVLYTSFTSDDMAKVVTPKDLEKLTERVADQKIAKADFAAPQAYTWFRVAIYSCINRNTSSVADPNAPPGFALGQLELFGVPAKAAAEEPAQKEEPTAEAK
jgi:hypothetical protein